MLPQPPSSPDLAPSDFDLSLRVKYQLQVISLAETKEVMEVLEGFNPPVFRDGFAQVETGLGMCIMARPENVEK